MFQVDSGIDGPYRADGTRCRWDRLPGAPRSGWQLNIVTDNHQATFECEFCGYPKVRYIHEIQHREWSELVYVGCCCSGHLTGDLPAAREAERKVKLEAARLTTFMDLCWKATKKGNFLLKKNGITVIAFEMSDRMWKLLLIDGDRKIYGSKKYPTFGDAKAGAFPMFDKRRHLRA